MKYRLKKDLPFAKAGTQVEYNLKRDEHYAIYLYSTDGDDPSTYWIGLECDNRDLVQLISEGWIEEVKPREWNARVINGSLVTSRPTYWTGDVKIENIKVREVIE